MCLPGICDPFDLEDCCGGSSTAAPPPRRRPVQQAPIRQQRVGVPNNATAARASGPSQAQAIQYPPEPHVTFLCKAVGYLSGPNGGTDQLPTVNVSRTDRGSIVLAGVPRGLSSIRPGEQGQVVHGCLRSVTKTRHFQNAQYYRTKKGLVILKGAQFY